MSFITIDKENYIWGLGTTETESLIDAQNWIKEFIEDAPDEEVPEGLVTHPTTDVLYRAVEELGGDIEFIILENGVADVVSNAPEEQEQEPDDSVPSEPENIEPEETVEPIKTFRDLEATIKIINEIAISEQDADRIDDFCLRDDVELSEKIAASHFYNKYITGEEETDEQVIVALKSLYDDNEKVWNH